MIPNLYIGNGCFTKHQFFNGCLGFQADFVFSPKLGDVSFRMVLYHIWDTPICFDEINYPLSLSSLQKVRKIPQRPPCFDPYFMRESPETEASWKLNMSIVPSVKQLCITFLTLLIIRYHWCIMSPKILSADCSIFLALAPKTFCNNEWCLQLKKPEKTSFFTPTWKRWKFPGFDWVSRTPAHRRRGHSVKHSRHHPCVQRQPWKVETTGVKILNGNGEKLA